MDEENKLLPKNRNDENNRKRDVLKSLLKNKKFDCNATDTFYKLSRLEKILKAKRDVPFEKLEQEGFRKIENTKNHPKYFFYDKRYLTVFSSTSSDVKTADNKFSELKSMFFLLNHL